MLLDLDNIFGAYQSQKSLVSSNKILFLYSWTLYNLFLKFFTFLSFINCILFKIFIIFLKITYLLSENYINNYIEINDFGDQTLFQILKNKKNNKYFIFKKIIKILNKIQLIKDKKVKNFKNKLYKVQEYKNKILFDETKLFCDWYAPKKLSKFKSIKFKKKFKSDVKNL